MNDSKTLTSSLAKKNFEYFVKHLKIRSDNDNARDGLQAVISALAKHQNFRTLKVYPLKYNSHAIGFGFEPNKTLFAVRKYAQQFTFRLSSANDKFRESWNYVDENFGCEDISLTSGISVNSLADKPENAASQLRQYLDLSLHVPYVREFLKLGLVGDPVPALSEQSVDDKPIDVSKVELVKVKAPIHTKDNESRGPKVKKNIKTNWAECDEKNTILGLDGEKLVLQYEVQKLKNLGRLDLAGRVKHVAAHSDGAGYDILSYDDHGKEMYIEVKTTGQSKGTPFFISRNEVKVSNEKGNQYWIYRVFGLKHPLASVSFYALQGPVENHFDLEPQNYKATIK